MHSPLERRAGASPDVSAHSSITDDSSLSRFRAIGAVSSSARSHDLAGDGPPKTVAGAVQGCVKLIGVSFEIAGGSGRRAGIHGEDCASDAFGPIP